MKAGKLIVLEGIDGTGKTTQAKKVLDYLRSQNILVSLFREPGGTPIGETIRNILLARKDYKGGLGQDAEFLLFASARAELSRLIIKPSLEKGRSVILDRFGLSSVAYQGCGRGLEVEFIKSVNRKATLGIDPDLILLLDLDVETALKRVKGGGDRIEQNGMQYFEKVRSGYLKEANDSANKCAVINAAKNIEEVFTDIKKQLDILEF